jgi:arylsulfatase A-like enzyme
MPDHPNILHLHSHDTGRYVQPLGYKVPTPSLQKRAGQGVLFRQAFDVAPTCSPSRESLLTGQCPHNNGMVGLANTLAIRTTGHGIAFPAMKCNLTVHGAGVFLIVRRPGGFSGLIRATRVRT